MQIPLPGPMQLPFGMLEPALAVSRPSCYRPPELRLCGLTQLLALACTSSAVIQTPFAVLLRLSINQTSKATFLCSPWTCKPTTTSNALIDVLQRNGPLISPAVRFIFLDPSYPARSRDPLCTRAPSHPTPPFSSVDPKRTYA
ncbi:hypothetical protein B0H12DRAFT_1235435 [Mycena haematopus]|nr:hypothetical protein B0H12DRAFT_1235435 [Mycena haematopus]